MAIKNTYTRQDVLYLVEQAFWDGVSSGGDDYAGEVFSPDSYLEDDTLAGEQKNR